MPMRELEIVFTKSKKPFALASWLIRFWTKQPFSHVARKLAISSSQKAGYYHATNSQVNYQIEDEFLKHHSIVYHYKLQVEESAYSRIGSACWEQSGKPYGLMQNLGIVLVDILDYFSVKIDNPWKIGKNCSELIYTEVFKVLNPNLNYNQETIKPHQIKEIIETYFQYDTVVLPSNIN